MRRHAGVKIARLLLVLVLQTGILKRAFELMVNVHIQKTEVVISFP